MVVGKIVRGRRPPLMPLEKCSVEGCGLDLVRWSDPEGRCLVCFYREFEERYPALVVPAGEGVLREISRGMES